MLLAWPCGLWEMLHRSTPFSEIPFSADLFETVIGGQRPVVDARFPRMLVDFIEECWHSDPSRRPTALQCTRRLRDLGRSLGDLLSINIPEGPGVKTETGIYKTGVLFESESKDAVTL